MVLKKGLASLVGLLKFVGADKQTPEAMSVAFPYNIGCDRAGGNWPDYLEMINEFAYIVHRDHGGRVLITLKPEPDSKGKGKKGKTKIAREDEAKLSIERPAAKTTTDTKGWQGSC